MGLNSFLWLEIFACLMYTWFLQSFFKQEVVLLWGTLIISSNGQKNKLNGTTHGFTYLLPQLVRLHGKLGLRWEIPEPARSAFNGPLLCPRAQTTSLACKSPQCFILCVRIPPTYSRCPAVQSELYQRGISLCLLKWSHRPSLQSLKSPLSDFFFLEMVDW